MAGRPDESPDGLFSFEDVGVQREDRWILRHVTARVPDDGVTAIVGPSGSGKTTLLRLCNRLDAPDEGIVRYEGRDLAGLDVLAHRRMVGMVFQHPVMFGGSVRDNLRVAQPAADDTRLSRALAEVGLPAAMLAAEAARLSGGEAQRMCLARTLITEPAVLLLDEPTSALDLENVLAFEHLILALSAGSGDGGARSVPVLWVTHDDQQLHRVADQVLALDSGRLAYAGPLPGLARDGVRP
jgi:putative ABC transport system ATP-binding protein